MAAVREKLAAIDKTAEELARAEELAENARLHSANAQKNFAGAQEKRRADAMAQLEACCTAREKAESEAARREQASAAADEAVRAGILRGAEPDETAGKKSRTRGKRTRHRTVGMDTACASCRRLRCRGLFPQRVLDRCCRGASRARGGGDRIGFPFA